jgi:2-hydroxy-3-keto-5-methylthiopentenyl-1-phosphate phosphatase
MLVRAVLVDFDGTASPVDVSEALLEESAEPGWDALDRAVARGELGLRDAVQRQVAMLGVDEDRMLAHVLERYRVAADFPAFVSWAEASGARVAVVSDGFGFHVRPMLDRAGLGHLEVRTNRMEAGTDGLGLGHPFGHPICRGCGACKMLADLEYRERFGPVAFVGEGQSDRYGALYADLVFAKGELARICRRDDVPYRSWATFGDVRTQLQLIRRLPGPIRHDDCPGWRT